MPRGRPRSSPEPPAEPPIGLEEAKRRRLWAVYRVDRGFFACARAGDPFSGEFVTWALDELSARNACNQRSRDELFPEGGRHARRAPAARP